MRIPTKYKIKDVVYTMYNNSLIRGKVYGIIIQVTSCFGKQLHNNGSDRLKYVISYKIVCEATRCHDEMENCFNENDLYKTEEECINNIRRIE